MLVQIEYINYNDVIKSAKYLIKRSFINIHIVKKQEINGQTEIEKNIDIAIHNERLSKVITKRYCQKDMLEYIVFFQ